MALAIEEVLSSVGAAKVPDVLFHYTSIDAALAIGKSKRIWATGVRFLNDSSEFQYFYELAETAFHSFAESESDSDRRDLYRTCGALLFTTKHYQLFVASFSAAPDVLSQWRAYASAGRGLSLGIRGDVIGRIPDTFLVPCVYEPEYQQQLLRVVMSRIQVPNPTKQGLSRKEVEGAFEALNEDFLKPMLVLAAAFKHPGFREEQEWRLVRIIEAKANNDVQYRAGLSTIVPYLSISLLDGVDDGSNWLPEIVVGPTPHPGLAQLAVEGYVRELDATSKVRLSVTPHRAW